MSVVLDNLAAGETAEQVASSYHIDAADVQAALLYAADLARYGVVELPEAPAGAA